MSQIEVKNRQIMAFGGVLSAVTWFLLGNMIGDNGIAYFAVAAECFMILFSLTGLRLSEGISRVLRSRYVKGQYKNADRVKSSVLLFQSVIGVLCGLLLFILAPVLAGKLFLVPYATLALRILAPALTVRVLTQIFLGYFQGSGIHMPTMIIHFLRQILYLVFSLLFVRMLYDYGDKVKPLLRDDCLPSMYGAAGMAIAVCVSELLLLLFVVFMYLISRNAFARHQEGLRNTESFYGAVGSLYGSMSPYVICEFLSRLPLWIGLFFFMKHTQNDGSAVISFGKYYGKYLVLCTVLILICGSFLDMLSLKTARAVRKGEQRYMKELFGTGLHMGVVIVLYPVVFLTVMSTQVSHLMEKTKGEPGELGRMFLIGSVMILFSVLAVYFSSTLVYMNKIKFVVLGLLVSAVVFTIFVIVFCSAPKNGIYGFIYASMISQLTLCVVTGGYLIRMLRVKFDFLYWICIPAGASAVSGLFCFFLGKYMTPHMGYSVTVSVGFLVGLLLYWILLIALRSFRSQELDAFSGGFLIRKVMHIFYGSKSE